MKERRIDLPDGRTIVHTPGWHGKDSVSIEDAGGTRCIRSVRVAGVEAQCQLIYRHRGLHQAETKAESLYGGTDLATDTVAVISWL